MTKQEYPCHSLLNGVSMKRRGANSYFVHFLEEQGLLMDLEKETCDVKEYFHLDTQEHLLLRAQGHYALETDSSASKDMHSALERMKVFGK